MYGFLACRLYIQVYYKFHKSQDFESINWILTFIETIFRLTSIRLHQVVKPDGCQAKYCFNQSEYPVDRLKILTLIYVWFYMQIVTNVIVVNYHDYWY